MHQTKVLNARHRFHVGDLIDCKAIWRSLDTINLGGLYPSWRPNSNSASNVMATAVPFAPIPESAHDAHGSGLRLKKGRVREFNGSGWFDDFSKLKTHFQ